MKKLPWLIALYCGIMMLPYMGFAQHPDLGILYNFVIFTKSGSVDNTGTSKILGNLGTNGGGTVSGFDPPTIVNGTIFHSDATTSRASIDLDTAFNQLNRTTITNVSHLAAFGSGETITPGVYFINSAGSVAGTLTLDGGADTNAVFILKFNGAISMGANTQVLLTNGAFAGNVFWVTADGAISIAAGCNIQGTLLAHIGAVAFGTNCTLQGRILSTGGAIPCYNLKVMLPLNYTATTWNGATGNSNWFDGRNWTNNIPATFINAIIPATLVSGRIFPIIDQSIGAVDSLTITGAGSLVIKNSVLQISQALINSGSLDATNGTIEMNGKLSQIIPANMFVGNTIANLIISNSVTLAGPLDITDTISFSNSNFTLTTGGFLTLKSTALGTASISDITNGGLDSANVISGAVTIERFIPAKRAWRLLSAPINASGAPTINTSWQEGATSGDPAAGYGLQITGGLVGNGYDQGRNGNSSIKVYNNASRSFVDLARIPGTKVSIASYPAYFLFIRGSRSTNLLQGVNAATSNTTLRIKGNINTGNIVTTINAAGITLVGNPYPAAIDFHAIAKINVPDKFYVWDPKLGGSLGLGGFVTLSWNGSSYDQTASISPVSRYIASGEAFFLSSLDSTTTGTLTIKESNKNTGGNDNVFRPMTAMGKIRINLLDSIGRPASLIDGILGTYDVSDANIVDGNDAKKMYSINENIAIERDGYNLSIEKRHTIVENDTTFLRLYNLKKQGYTLKVITEAIDNNLTAVLKDNYSANNNNMPLRINDTSLVFFKVNTDSGSFAPDRFSIVFATAKIPVINFVSAKVLLQKKDILVTWQTPPELNISIYEIESSDNGTVFTTATTFKSNEQNFNGISYKWLDKNASPGFHYYRIKFVDFDGRIGYSQTFNIQVLNSLSKPDILVCGNLITDKKINIEFKNVVEGTYIFSLFSMSGQSICSKTISHKTSLDSFHNFPLNTILSSGKYELQITGKGVQVTLPVIKN